MKIKVHTVYIAQVIVKTALDLNRDTAELTDKSCYGLLKRNEAYFAKGRKGNV